MWCFHALSARVYDSCTCYRSSVQVCVCARGRACVSVCVCVFVRVRVRACVRAWVLEWVGEQVSKCCHEWCHLVVERVLLLSARALISMHIKCVLNHLLLWKWSSISIYSKPGHWVSLKTQELSGGTHSKAACQKMCKLQGQLWCTKVWYWANLNSPALIFTQRINYYVS